MTSFALEKIMQISISNSSQGLTPLGGTENSRTADNRHKKVIKLPLTEMEKTATSKHFPGTTLLFSPIIQKQKSREMPPRN